MLLALEDQREDPNHDQKADQEDDADGSSEEFKHESLPGLTNVAGPVVHLALRLFLGDSVLLLNAPDELIALAFLLFEIIVR